MIWRETARRMLSWLMSGRSFRRLLCASSSLLLAPASLSTPSYGQQPFLTGPQWASIRNEAGGAAAYENLRVLTRFHRVPATSEFDQAADYILQRAKEYGLNDAHKEEFPVDGKIHYGLMRSHLAWHVEAGQLWQTAPDHALLGDWQTEPIRLADYSHSADVKCPLVDVGSGSAEADYADKDVRGKIVLADGVLSEVQRLAVMKYGAAGIVSDMPNQTTAWSGLDPTVVRWGHLDASLPNGFAFMVSRGTAAALRQQMSMGQPVMLSAHVQATVGPGHWTVVSGIIPGSDPHAGEVVYSCHLDHQRPGANDNASGCVSILEVARVMATLVASGRLPRPARTIRFLWGPEVEGTMAFLSQHPQTQKSMQADIHMDMVGGDPFKNKSMLHVTETPWSLPSFVTDVGELFAEMLRDAAASYAEDGSNPEAAVLEVRAGGSGTRNEFLVDSTPYAEGSDHDDYDSSTIAVPSLYLRDWPDIYIHTDHDTLEQIDSTKLRRVVVLGAASGYTYASLDPAQASASLPFLAARSEQRLAKGFERALSLVNDPRLEPGDAWYEARNLTAQMLSREQAVLQSLARYTHSQPQQLENVSEDLNRQVMAFQASIDAAAAIRGTRGTKPAAPWQGNAEAQRIPARIGDFGPLTYQNDDVLLDRLGSERVEKIRLLSGASSRLLRVQDSGGLYAYEIVNLVDGKRSVGQIRDVVSAEYGPIDVGIVGDYLRACAEAGIVSFK
jgi:aminopeptidase YwaD